MVWRSRKHTTPCLSAQASRVCMEGLMAWSRECCSCVKQTWCFDLGRKVATDNLHIHTGTTKLVPHH